MNISDCILYSGSVSLVKVLGFYEEGSFWLSQKRRAELFDVEVQTINFHLKEIYKSGELSENSTIRKFRIVQTKGKRGISREVDFYNLDAVIAVGYNVNSFQATQFRIWATKTLKEYIMQMTDWIGKLDASLQFNVYNLLKDAGKMSNKVATKLDKKAYEQYRVVQDQNYESDFDRVVKKLKNKKPQE